MKNNYFFKRILSVVVLLMVSSLMWGQYFEVDGIYYSGNENGESVEVTIYGDWENPYSGDIVIPSTVTYGDKTYSVTGIRGSAFSSCSSLTSVVIPNSVTSIGDYAFSECSSLTSVVIPNSVTSIGIYAFYRCSSLTSVVIPNSVTSIGTYAFYECSSLTSVEISNSVTSIGEAAFYGCSSLVSVVIPNSVTSIGIFAFYYCSSLESVVIPNSVTSIGFSAFYGCSSLTSIICYAEEVPELGGWVFTGIPQSEATLYVPASALEAYKAADQWKDFGTILPLDEDAMGITSTTAEQETDATYYTLDGVSVKSPTKKGIYIKNGKKVFINK